MCASLADAQLPSAARPGRQPHGAHSAHAPQHGASDGGGHFWGFICNTTHLFRVDAVSMAVQVWEIPNANGYGITVDCKQRVWMSSTTQRYDPALPVGARHESVGGVAGSGAGGIAVDAQEIGRASCRERV